MSVQRLGPAQAGAYRAAAQELVLGNFANALPMQEAPADDAQTGADPTGVAGLAFEQRKRTRHKASLFGMSVRCAAQSCALVARRWSVA